MFVPRMRELKKILMVHNGTKLMTLWLLQQIVISSFQFQALSVLFHWQKGKEKHSYEWKIEFWICSSHMVKASESQRFANTMKKLRRAFGFVFFPWIGNYNFYFCMLQDKSCTEEWRLRDVRAYIHKSQVQTTLNYQVKCGAGVERAASSWWAEPDDAGSQNGSVFPSTHLCEGRITRWPRWCPAEGSAPPHCAALFQGGKPAGSRSGFSPRRRAQTARHRRPAGCPICTGARNTHTAKRHTLLRGDCRRCEGEIFNMEIILRCFKAMHHMPAKQLGLQSGSQQCVKLICN